MIMQPGDVRCIPRETVHAFRNACTTQGRLRYVMLPALKKKRCVRIIQGNAALSETVMADVAKEHG